MLIPLASELRAQFARVLEELAQPSLIGIAEAEGYHDGAEDIGAGSDGAMPDMMAGLERIAISAVRDNQRMMDELPHDGVPWGGVMACIADHLPATLDDPEEEAFHLVPKVLTAIFGERDEGWHAFQSSCSRKVWVKAGPKR